MDVAVPASQWPDSAVSLLFVSPLYEVSCLEALCWNPGIVPACLLHYCQLPFMCFIFSRSFTMISVAFVAFSKFSKMPLTGLTAPICPLPTCPWAGPCWPSCRCDETAGNCSSALSIEDIWESDTLWFPGSLAKQGARSWQPHGVARASGGGRWARALCALLPCPVRSNPRWTVPPGDRRSLPVTFSLAIRLGPAFSLGADCFVAGKETDPLAWLEHAQRQRNSSERLFGMQPLTCKPVLLLMLRSATWRCLVD